VTNNLLGTGTGALSTEKTFAYIDANFASQVNGSCRTSLCAGMTAGGTFDIINDQPTAKSGG
jgi:hypothetical protein